MEILGQKWRALPNFRALRNRQNLVLGKNNQVSLTIGQILGTAAENTGWLACAVTYDTAQNSMQNGGIVLVWMTSCSKPLLSGL